MEPLKVIRFSDSTDFNAQDSFNNWNEKHPNVEVIDIKVVNVTADFDCIYLFYREPSPKTRVSYELEKSLRGVSTYAN